MQTCAAAEGVCRYCGSSEIILWPLESAGQCATCSWAAHVGRDTGARLHDMASRAERESFALQGVLAAIPMPERKSHYRIRRPRPPAFGRAKPR